MARILDSVMQSAILAANKGSKTKISVTPTKAKESTKIKLTPEEEELAKVEAINAKKVSGKVPLLEPILKKSYSRGNNTRSIISD